MSLTDFIDRLLTKRCVSFVGFHDYYKLISGETGFAENYIYIGTHLEEEPFILNKVISYDEVKLSVFLSISSYSELLNDGNRDNEGVIEKDLSKIEREGIVMGIIGARFQKPFYMEYQDIVITAEQNIKERGYGYSIDSKIPQKAIDRPSSIDYRKLWQKFYDNKDLLFENVPKENPRFATLTHYSDEIFDNVMMKKRYAITFDTLLLESQSRAEKLNKQAYVHIVGIGLGAWREADQQTEIFLECFNQRVKHLLPKLNNIGVLHFSWFNKTEWQDLKHNGFIKSTVHPLGGIKTFLENRNPADKLKGPEFESMLLVISYAWDGNALPGNEFWYGHLSDSCDSSTACSTLITELHNPHINTDYINGNNLHIATSEYGIVHISDYVKKILN